MKKLLLILTSIMMLVSCTDNQRVKRFGGTATLNIAPDKKLVNVTWKKQNLWVLTTDRNKDTVYNTYYFHEESNYGIMEGTYKIIETK